MSEFRVAACWAEGFAAGRAAAHPDPPDGRKPMSDTRTVSTDVRYALCACCTDHTTGDNASRLLAEITTCRECGRPCSCEGCVAEQEETPGGS